MSIKKPVNKIEKLIDELCPEGVEFRALGEVGKVSMCKRIFKNQTSAVGQIPFYKIGTFGKMPDAFISQEIFNDYRKKYSFPKKGDVLLSASGTIGRRVIYDGEPAYFQDSNIIWIDNDENKVLNKFLYYFYSIVTWQTEGGTIKRLYNDNLKKIKIPIPPLTIQKEIVKILDNFTQLEAELEAELEARKKQYEHYREALLSFDDGVEFRELGEVADYVDYRGKTPKKTADGIFLVTAKNIRKGYIDYNTSQEFISENDYNLVMRRGFPEIGDVLITTEAPCGFVAQVDRKNIALAQRVIKYRSKNELLLNSFLKYYLLGSQFQKKLDKTATGSTVKGIKGSKLHKLTIPIPPLTEQKRIVAILDKFDALVNDISVGLPAEISARKKQYEYYRNQLLTFTPLDSCASNGVKPALEEQDAR